MRMHITLEPTIIDFQFLDVVEVGNQSDSQTQSADDNHTYPYCQNCSSLRRGIYEV